MFIQSFLLYLLKKIKVKLILNFHLSLGFNLLSCSPVQVYVLTVREGLDRGFHGSTSGAKRPGAVEVLIGGARISIT